MDEAGTWHGGRPQPKRLCVRWGPSTPPQKGVELPSPIFGPFLLWPNGWMHQDANWYGCRPQPRGLCIRWITRPHSAFATLCSMWTQLPPEKKGYSHSHSHRIFGPCLLWPNGWMDEEVAWYRSRPRLRPHCTRRGHSERGTASPLFSAHVYCGHGRPSQLLLSSCWNFISPVTLTLTLDWVMRNTVVHHSSTSIYIANFTEIGKTSSRPKKL